MLYNICIVTKNSQYVNIKLAEYRIFLYNIFGDFMARELQAYQLIERSIIKKFRKEIWNPFIEAVKNYRLVNVNDRINVSVENNKKSVLLAKLMQQLHRVSNVPFEIEFKDESNINICEKFGIPTVENFSQEGKTVNTICFTDVVQKTLKSILLENETSAYLPVEDNEINPLFCIKEEAIDSWVRYNNLDFPTEERQKFELAELTPEVEHSIFKAVHAVCLDTIPAYEQNNEIHTFLEKY